MPVEETRGEGHEPSEWAAGLPLDGGVATGA
jgi:hypothetical protein